MVDKVYTPEVISENPFPSGVELIASQAQSQSGDTYSPTTTKEQTVPKKRTAVELLSSALNTRSRKILGEFELKESGGIKVGNYKDGSTGDLRITPDGLTARDKAGLTTFAIDGDTGDAIFAGQLRAGSTIVSDTIVTEESSNGNGRTVYYNNGIPAIVIGDPD